MSLADQVRFVPDPTLPPIKTYCVECGAFDPFPKGQSVCRNEKWDKTLPLDSPACAAFKAHTEKK